MTTSSEESLKTPLTDALKAKVTQMSLRVHALDVACEAHRKLELENQELKAKLEAMNHETTD